MIDHISLRVSDFNKAVTFYKAALAPLGYVLVAEYPGMAGFGIRGKLDFWVSHSDKPINPTHVAFVADRKGIAAFHEAGLKANGVDNGAPGLRPEYHPNYFGAFVLDPDGNNIEAACHTPESAAKNKSAAKGKSAVESRVQAKPAAKGKAKPVKKKPAAKAKPPAKKRPAAKAKPPAKKKPAAGKPAARKKK